MAGIAFDEIPIDRLEPGTFLEVKPNYSERGLLPYPARNLIIAPRLAIGKLEPGKIVEITRLEEAEYYLGQGSVGAQMVRAFRAANKTQPLFVIAIDDYNGGNAAVRRINFSGSINDGTVATLAIGGIPIQFSTSASISQLALELTRAINVRSELPVTASCDASGVDLTMKQKGEFGEVIDFSIKGLPTGVSYSWVRRVTGNGAPTLQNTLDIISNSWFTTIVQPYTDAQNMKAFEEFLKKRFLATEKLDTIGFTFASGTYADLSLFGARTNCAQLVCGGLNKSPAPPWIQAASAAAVAALHLANDPSRQLKSLVIPNVIAPDEKDQFIDVEKDNLLRRGISTFNCLADGSVTFSRLISTYKTNTLGIDDRAYLDIMTVATMIRIRYDFTSYLGLLYPRAKLATNDSLAVASTAIDNDGDFASSIVTPRIMAGVWAGRCKLYEQYGWIINSGQTIKQSSFEIDASDKNRLNARLVVDIIGNLMIFAGTLEFKAKS